VGAVTLDPRDGRAVVLLVHDAPPRAPRVFPVWVGDDEAASIARALSARPHGEHVKMPDTQSLLVATVEALGARIEHVELTGVVDRVVTAVVVLGDAEGSVQLNARASDAIAIALHMDAPIVVHDELLSQVAVRVADAEARTGSRSATAAEPVQLSQAERWNQLLAHLSTSRSPKSYEG
jgi:uncharacterized protein